MILAIDIGGTHYKLALASGEGQIHQQRQGSTDRAGGASWMIPRILEEGRALLTGAPEKVHACGIGFGGPVDFEGQRILSSTHVGGWNEIRLPGIIEEELGVRAVVENDANAGGLGELVFGVGQGCRHLVYLTISTGIGGGIIIDGHIYRGANGQAGELGHLPILPEGPRCDCGNQGCLEALCSGKSIARRAEEAVARQPDRGAGLRRLAGDEAISAEVVFDAAQQGDLLASELVEETCRFLGMGLATLMNTLAPEMIVLGGGVSRAGETLLAPLRRATLRYTMPVHRSLVRLEQARFPDEAVLLGAVALARELV